MHALRRIFIAAVVAGSSLSPLSADAVYSPAGSEFQVNSYTLDDQLRASIAADADGDFVVVWDSRLQDGFLFGVFGQRFASSGAALGSEFQVNSWTASVEYLPDVASDADGDFVVVWTGYVGGFSVFGQRFASSGAELGSEFQVNSFTASFYFGSFAPNVASDADGDFVVVWNSNFQDGTLFGVFGQRFASSGAALGSEFQVNSYTNFDQRDPQVASDADGDLVVVWTSHQDGQSFGVFGQRFTSGGSPSGTEFQINSYTLNYQGEPDVAADADGDFVVVWSTFPYQDGSSVGAMGQRFDNTGAPVGTEFAANVYTIGLQHYPAVAMDADGDFAVTWTSEGQDGSNDDQFVRRFDSSGSADGSELQVNTYTAGVQFLASTASSPEGNLIVVWRSVSQDGDGQGVFGQRFDVLTTPSANPTPTGTPAPTTRSPTNTPIATPVGACPLTGDCDSNDRVTVDELVGLVSIVLGNTEPSACARGGPSGAAVDVAMLVQAVNSALHGCGGRSRGHLP